MASIIKADNIQKVSDGTNIIKKCGSTTTIGSGACSPIVICGSTVTLGRCGGTVTLASGATQTGFGRTGTVDWCTTAKTSPFTGVSGKGYFVNTTCGAVTVTLPATPTAGDIISVADYASTFQTNNVTLCRNSSKINGACTNAFLSTQGQSITLVYVDGTRGWKNTMDSTSDVTGIPSYVVATGGTITCCGDYKIHTFTADGCFSVTNAGQPTGSNTVDYLVVAGGGGGIGAQGGGGGAGGFRLSNSTGMPAPLTSPLATPTALPVSVQTYPITVGAGGTGGNTVPNACTVGNPSVFSTITSTAGGGGSCGSGGSGAGANGERPTPNTGGGSGNTPPVSPPQGNPGGTGDGPYPNNASGGGGGAGAAGTNGSVVTGGPGGIGSYVVATGFAGANGTPGPVCGARYFAGGGGGGTEAGPAGAGTSGAGGIGGGGQAGPPASNTTPGPGTAGSANTGGGGGAGSRVTTGTNTGQVGGNGGSGIVIIRYKYQN